MANKKVEYKFKKANLRLHGVKHDTNGNPCFVLSTPNQRSFSRQIPYSISILWDKNDDGATIVEKNTKGRYFNSAEELEDYIIDLAKNNKHVKVYKNNFSYQDVDGHFKGSENFRMVEFNEKRLVMETDTMRSTWEFSGEAVVSYKTIDLTSGKEIEHKDRYSYHKKSQGLTENFDTKKGMLVFLTPTKSFTFDLKEEYLIDEKGNKAELANIDKMFSECDAVCKNIKKSIEKVVAEYKQYGALKIESKAEVLKTIKKFIPNSNFSFNEELTNIARPYVADGDIEGFLQDAREHGYHDIQSNMRHWEHAKGNFSIADEIKKEANKKLGGMGILMF